MGLETKSGKIVLLRVNEVGDVFGPANDNMQVEVVVQLDSHVAGAASGFKLRTDGSQPVRQGMLDLLRDAFNHGWRVGFDHQIAAGKTKGIIIRVWLTKDPAQPTGGTLVSGPLLGTVVMR
ncbi:hypothetical protein [Methylibium sp.]|jgi:hypothetical protein|uniref:hypothetical protein n=1 Tax=Methylibium sp. TaxID=2067992 RepID=UPI003D0FB92A